MTQLQNDWEPVDETMPPLWRSSCVAELLVTHIVKLLHQSRTNTNWNNTKIIKETRFRFTNVMLQLRSIPIPQNPS